jgi:hypothetical protein
LALFTAIVRSQMLRDSGFMNDRDYQTYRSLFANMSNFMVRTQAHCDLHLTGLLVVC